MVNFLETPHNKKVCLNVTKDDSQGWRIGHLIAAQVFES